FGNWWKPWPNFVMYLKPWKRLLLLRSYFPSVEYHRRSLFLEPKSYYTMPEDVHGITLFGVLKKVWQFVFLLRDKKTNCRRKKEEKKKER
ncbi:MAG: hypothetical protein ACYTX0_38165, partial [Nostoc sp.]